MKYVLIFLLGLAVDRAVFGFASYKGHQIINSSDPNRYESFEWKFWNLLTYIPDGRD